jgi:hypothetical protein
MAVVLASGRQILSVDARLRQKTVLELRGATAHSLELDVERVMLLLNLEVLEDGEAVEDVLQRGAWEQGRPEDVNLTGIILDNGVEEPLDPHGSELWGDICRRQRAAEERHVVAANMLARHPELNARMFGILMDWVFQVGRKYRFSKRTVMLAHSILIRFMSHGRPIPRVQLQLCGIVSMVLASKYEEVRPMSVDTAVFQCADAYDAMQVRNMEVVMLGAIDFALEVPTAEHFKERFTRANKSDATKLRLTACVVDLALQEASMVATRPSLLAAAAVLVSNRQQNQEDADPWPQGLVNVTSYKEADLSECADALEVLLLNVRNSPLGEIRQQYPDVIA